MSSSVFRVKSIEIKGVPYFLVLPLTYQPKLAAPLYQFTNCRWDSQLKGWTLERTTNSEKFLKDKFGYNTPMDDPEGKVNTQTLQSHPVGREKRLKKGNRGISEPLSNAVLSELIDVEELLRVRRYAWTTIKSYLSHLRIFFSICRKDHPKEITSLDIRKTVVEIVLINDIGSSAQVQLLSAIRFWWEQVLERDKLAIQLLPRKEKKLPQVLSQEEIRRLFRAINNIKHRLILMLIYSGGLRLGELCRLRTMDIHIERKEIFVHCSKGKKDRYTTLAETVIPELRTYLEEYRPSYWLFEGQSGGAYSSRSVQAILRKAVARSGVNPLATVHTLRHSYATHLLEQGVSLRHIQTLLGHNSSKTTEIYTKVSRAERRKVRSPLDNL